jgi:hypothetical protein
MSARGSAQADRLRLQDIRDGVVVLRGGHFRAVMEVGSVNLLLLDDTDQQALIASFAAALNSWSFPVQVLIRVLPVDLDRYLAAMERRTAQLSGRLAELARDHRLYVRRLARNDALLDHRSYVVVPADEPRRRWPLFGGRAKEQPQRLLSVSVRQQLNLRCREVQRGLSRCNLSARRLDTQELAELYYAFLCPELSQVQRLRSDLADCCTLVVTTPAPQRQAA